GALGEWVFGPIVIALGYMLLVFPTGRLRSLRWRPVLIVGLIAAVVTTLGFVLNPTSYGIPAPGGLAVRVANPTGIASLGDVISTVLVGSVFVVVATVGAAFLSLIFRY